MKDYYLFALNHIPCIMPETALKLREYWPDLKELFHLSEKELTDFGMKPVMASAIAQFDFNPVDKVIAYCQQHDYQIISYDNPLYPALLHEIAQPPLILYAAGNTALLDQPSLAIVGSRKPSSMGKHHAHDFAKALAEQDLVITSGLAIGIDTACHQGALAASGKTIAVMATGIDEIYPRRNHELAQNIRKNGLLITEFPLNSPPKARQFPRRNRIISGLSLGTLVIEAAIKSGSLITARRALEQNREVFALPGAINNPMTQGCHYLVQQGAKLVTNIRDILDDLPLKKSPRLDREYHAIAAEDEIVLAKNLQNLVEFVNYEVTSVNNIADKSGLATSTLLSQLVELELLGKIKAVPGGYVRC